MKKELLGDENHIHIENTKRPPHTHIHKTAAGGGDGRCLEKLKNPVSS